MSEIPGPPSQPLFDISGMSTSDAKSYILSIAAHLKQAETELAACEEECSVWEGRVKLAEQKGLLELQTQASARATELRDKKVKLEMEVWEFRDGVDKLKKDLLMLPSTQRTVNTQALLDNLASIGGPLDQVTPTVKKLEAEDALAALKRKMAGG